MRRSPLVALGAVVAFLLAACIPTTKVPEVSDPIAGTPVIYGHTSFDLASAGYRQSEYFISGTAEAYSPEAPLTSDGMWSVKPTSFAPFTTRLLVNRPIDPEKFNGTVIVEWLNVSGGIDASPDWVQTHVELLRRGYAWVGVSAQAVGVNALKGEALGDPERYASLNHPGDSYSYDIYSQAGRAVVGNPDKVLDGLRPRTIIAAGESQSAGRLVAYINAVNPLAKVYDGFIVHSRQAGGAPLSQAPLPAVTLPIPTLIRADLRQPTLVFNTESDVGALQARQPDSPWFRLWEAAGTAHFDHYGLVLGATDSGDLDSATAWFDSMLNPTNRPGGLFECATPINSGPQTYALRAAVDALNDWVVKGKLPPTAPRLQTTSISPVQYVLDANGNVLGGVRNPAVDAPVAKLSGLGQSGAQFCALFGTTIPFTDAQLDALYSSHKDFVTKWKQAVKDAKASGFLVAQDANLLRQAAADSGIGR